jgi:anti-anti-sigma factor
VVIAFDRTRLLVEIEVITTRELALLRCRGRLVLGDGAALLREVASRALAAGQAVALDLGRVSQMDAHATGVLAELIESARNQGVALVLARVSDRVRRILRVTRLDQVIPLSRSSALQPGAALHNALAADWSCRTPASARV